MLRGGWLALFFAGFSLISLSNRAPGQSAPVLREVIADHPQLPMPFGFAFTPDRALIVSDYKKHQIVRVEPGATPRVRVLAGNGTPGNTDGTGPVARLNAPHDVVSLSDGRVLVADTYNHRVCQIDPQTGALSTVSGEGGKGFAGDGGPGGLIGGQAGAFGVAGHGAALGVGQMGGEPLLALGQRLGVGHHDFDAF